MAVLVGEGVARRRAPNLGSLNNIVFFVASRLFQPRSPNFRRRHGTGLLGVTVLVTVAGAVLVGGAVVVVSEVLVGLILVVVEVAVRVGVFVVAVVGLVVVTVVEVVGLTTVVGPCFRFAFDEAPKKVVG